MGHDASWASADSLKSQNMIENLSVFQAVIRSSLYWRGMAQSLWGEGLRVKPNAGVRSSSSSPTPGGGVKRNCWRRDVKKRKISILARPSPRHTLRPAGRGSFEQPKNSGSILTSLSVILKMCTCRKRHEGVSLDEFTILIQKVGGVEGVRGFPLVLVIQDRGQKRKHSSPLNPESREHF